LVDRVTTTTTRPRDGRHWLRVFTGGLLLWAASVVVTFWTANANLVPTVILLGSFLVPVTFVLYALERLADHLLTTQRIFTAFIYGGVLGVLGASILEAQFLKQPSGLAYLGVGFIEEAVKLGALWLLAWRLPRYTMRDGIVFGAAVGFGFAAFETAGYPPRPRPVDRHPRRRAVSSRRAPRPAAHHRRRGGLGIWSCRCCTACRTPPEASRCG
jgi:PrsW family intramembrane metalloprotease